MAASQPDSTYYGSPERRPGSRAPRPTGERKSVEEGAARRAWTPGEARVDCGLAVFEGRPGRGGARRDALQPARGRRTCAHARLRGADDVVQAHPPLARAPGRARTRRCPAAVEAVVERRDTRLLRAPERAPAALDCAAAVLPGLTARLHGDPTAAERGHARELACPFGGAAGGRAPASPCEAGHGKSAHHGGHRKCESIHARVLPCWVSGVGRVQHRCHGRACGHGTSSLHRFWLVAHEPARPAPR